MSLFKKGSTEAEGATGSDGLLMPPVLYILTIRLASQTCTPSLLGMVGRSEAVEGHGYLLRLETGAPSVAS